MKPTFDTETAWASGLFEGEGCVSVQYGCVRLKLAMSDEDVVKRWGAVLGCGKLYGPYPPRGSGTKAQWQWSVHRFDDVEAVCIRLRPWLGIRRSQQIVTAFEAHWKQREKIGT